MGKEIKTTITNYVTLLQQRVQQGAADQLAYCYINRRGEQQNQITYAELDKCALAVAAQLQQHKVTVSDRVIILLKNDLNYIEAFFGCLYCGAIAVTLHPPVSKSQLSRLAHVVSDAKPRAILTTQAIQQPLQQRITNQFNANN